jgi:hypothetical protein
MVEMAMGQSGLFGVSQAPLPTRFSRWLAKEGLTFPTKGGGWDKKEGQMPLKKEKMKDFSGRSRQDWLRGRAILSCGFFSFRTVCRTPMNEISALQLILLSREQEDEL